MWNGTSLTEDEQQRCYQTFRRGFAYFTEAVEHDPTAIVSAIACLQRTMEWATPQSWPELHRNAAYLLRDAWHMRHTLQFSPR